MFFLNQNQKGLSYSLGLSLIWEELMSYGKITKEQRAIHQGGVFYCSPADVLPNNTGHLFSFGEGGNRRKGATVYIGTSGQSVLGISIALFSWLLTLFAIELRKPCLATAESSHAIPMDRTLTYQTKGATNGKFQVLVLFIFMLMLLQRVFKEADA